MIRQTPFVILSAERGCYADDVNRYRTSQLAEQIAARDHDSAAVLGCYEHGCERSFLLLCEQGEDDVAYSDALRLACRYGQHSVLYVDANRHALLINPKNGAIARSLGQWRRATPEEARARDAYTRATDGAFYVCGG